MILTQTQVRRHHLLDQLFQLQVALAGTGRLMDTLKLKHKKPTRPLDLTKVFESALE